jgi:ADP-ribose pyrophosphatase YjhB (NUDIX family)
MTPTLRFCPACAGPLAESQIARHGAHPVCASCGFVLWQNLKPCVDALIVRTVKGWIEVLLGRRATEPNIGLWDTPGGFLNVGDTPESRLIEECRAEVGVNVRLLELVDARTDTFSNIPIVTLFYRCDAASGEPAPGEVIDRVQWFPLAQLPPLAYPAVQAALGTLRDRLQHEATEGATSA